MKYIHAQWESYSAEVIPVDAPLAQQTESRRAFYAGAQALFHIIMLQVLVDPGPEPTDRELIELDSVKQELDAFAVDVRYGRA